MGIINKRLYLMERTHYWRTELHIWEGKVWGLLPQVTRLTERKKRDMEGTSRSFEGLLLHIWTSSAFKIVSRSHYLNPITQVCGDTLVKSCSRILECPPSGSQFGPLSFHWQAKNFLFRQAFDNWTELRVLSWDAINFFYCVCLCEVFLN